MPVRVTVRGKPAGTSGFLGLAGGADRRACVVGWEPEVREERRRRTRATLALDLFRGRDPAMSLPLGNPMPDDIGHAKTDDNDNDADDDNAKHGMVLCLRPVCQIS